MHRRGKDEMEGIEGMIGGGLCVCVCTQVWWVSSFHALLGWVHGRLWLEADEAGTDPCMQENRTFPPERKTTKHSHTHKHTLNNGWEKVLTSGGVLWHYLLLWSSHLVAYEISTDSTTHKTRLHFYRGHKSVRTVIEYRRQATCMCICVSVFVLFVCSTKSEQNHSRTIQDGLKLCSLHASLPQANSSVSLHQGEPHLAGATPLLTRQCPCSPCPPTGIT